MQALVVEFRIHPAFAEAFVAAIVDNARASRDTEPGCHQFDVCRDAADPGLFYLYELYADEAAVQAHLKSAHFLHFSEATAAWVVDKRVSRYTRVSP